MIHFTIYKHDMFNSIVFDYCSSLCNLKLTIDEFNENLSKYLEELFFKIPGDPFELEKVNNCLLIYRGLNHLFTIKFDL